MIRKILPSPWCFMRWNECYLCLKHLTTCLAGETTSGESFLSLPDAKHARENQSQRSSLCSRIFFLGNWTISEKNRFSRLQEGGQTIGWTTKERAKAQRETSQCLASPWIRLERRTPDDGLRHERGDQSPLQNQGAARKSLQLGPSDWEKIRANSKQPDSPSTRRRWSQIKMEKSWKKNWKKFVKKIYSALECAQNASILWILSREAPKTLFSQRGDEWQTKEFFLSERKVEKSEKSKSSIFRRKFWPNE